MKIRIYLALLAAGLSSAVAQVPNAVPSEAPQLLSADQLDNLVAPVALYPDPLLSQVLAASTYPLEIIEAQQWLGRNGNLQGQQLIEAAKQQNWDASVQALVAFPDAMTLLTRDIQWTTALGNAFLAQQTDVMNAIQRMRARAQTSGRLANGPQQTVTQQGGAIEIQPANPQVIYVPVYNPEYVWGAPAWGAYPPLWYPPVSAGFWFGPAINIGAFFAGFAGLLGWAGWGWGLNWLAHGLFLNGLFFSHFGFHGGGYYGGGYGGRVAWVHDPVHRGSVPYPNRAVASRFGGGYRGAGAGFATHGGFSGGGFAGAARTGTSGGGWHSAGGAQSFTSPGGGGYRGFSGNYGQSPAAGYRNGFASSQRGSNTGGSSTFAPRGESFTARNFSQPRSSQSQFSQPRSFGSFSGARAGAQHFSGGGARFSGSSGGGSHGGGHFGGGGHGGGGHSGGGHGGSHHR